MTVSDLRRSDIMAHLLDGLSEGHDIGHYGRLVFVIVAQYFLSESELVKQLLQDPNMDRQAARSLYTQVKAKQYSPPKRDRILEWQTHQFFPICPDTNDPNGCNLYSDLTFPSQVYDSIEQYHQKQPD